MYFVNYKKAITSNFELTMLILKNVSLGSYQTQYVYSRNTLFKSLYFFL